jgi:hypothetical protein
MVPMPYRLTFLKQEEAIHGFDPGNDAILGYHIIIWVDFLPSC